MAISPIGKNNGKRKRIISDINITPLVDVLLVLLIIFMVAAPMMTSGVSIDLPKGAPSETNSEIHSISVSIKKDETIFLQESQVAIEDLSTKLMEISDNNTENQVYVRADHGIDYGKVMEVVRLINLTGFRKVVLVTQIVQW